MKKPLSLIIEQDYPKMKGHARVKVDNRGKFYNIESPLKSHFLFIFRKEYNLFQQRFQVDKKAIFPERAVLDFFEKIQ
jgi:hypothetical protein